MDIGQIARPSITSAQPAARADAAAPGRPPVKTDLPQAEVVTGAAASAAARLDLSARAAPGLIAKQSLLGFIDRHNDIDPESRTLVTQTVDTRSGEVVRQYPDVSALRLRAYQSSVRDRAIAESSGPAPDNRRVERVA